MKKVQDVGLPMKCNLPTCVVSVFIKHKAIGQPSFLRNRLITQSSEGKTFSTNRAANKLSRQCVFDGTWTQVIMIRLLFLRCGPKSKKIISKENPFLLFINSES